jgi:hypothetical protein
VTNFHLKNAGFYNYWLLLSYPAISHSNPRLKKEFPEISAQQKNGFI